MGGDAMKNLLFKTRHGYEIRLRADPEEGEHGFVLISSQGCVADAKAAVIRELLETALAVSNLTVQDVIEEPEQPALKPFITRGRR
jgi:hypothetical protein